MTVRARRATRRVVGYRHGFNQRLFAPAGNYYDARAVHLLNWMDGESYTPLSGSAVFEGYSHKSAIMQFQHCGLRAMQV